MRRFSSDCDEKFLPAAVLHAMSFFHGTKSLLYVLVGEVEHAFLAEPGGKSIAQNTQWQMDVNAAKA